MQFYISHSFKHSAYLILVCKYALVKEFYVTTKMYVKLDETRTHSLPLLRQSMKNGLIKKPLSLFSKQLFYSYLSVHEYFITEGTRQTYFFCFVCKQYKHIGFFKKELDTGMTECCTNCTIRVNVCMYL